MRCLGTSRLSWPGVRSGAEIGICLSTCKPGRESSRSWRSRQFFFKKSTKSYSTRERELTKSLRLSLLRQARWGLIFSPICMSGRPQSKTSGQSKTVSSGHAWSFSSASRLRFDPTSLSEEKRLTLLAYVDFVGTRHCYSHPRQSARHGDLLPSIYGLKVRCMEASHGSEPLH